MKYRIIKTSDGLFELREQNASSGSWYYVGGSCYRTAEEVEKHLVKVLAQRDIPETIIREVDA